MAILSSPSRGDYEKIPILDGPDFGLQVKRVATLFGGVRRLFFARDPECADGDGEAALSQPLPQLSQRMSLLAATAERISSACASIRCEWRSPPWRLGLTSPSRRSVARHRIALDALTPNRCAAARPTTRRQSRQRHACEGQGTRIWPCTPASFAGKKQSDPTRFGNPPTIQSNGKML
jgi:hypothetical protein